MLGGGLVPGTNVLLNGPSGIGKTSTAVRCGLSALERGVKAAYYLFDEGKATMLSRWPVFEGSAKRACAMPRLESCRFGRAPPLPAIRWVAG